MGENKTFVGGDDYLRSRGVEVLNAESDECYQLMLQFIKEVSKNICTYTNNKRKEVKKVLIFNWLIETN
jgi:hypothetical protein